MVSNLRKDDTYEILSRFELLARSFDKLEIVEEEDELKKTARF